MSWSEVKKINDNLNVPLNKYNYIDVSSSGIEFIEKTVKSTPTNIYQTLTAIDIQGEGLLYDILMTTYTTRYYPKGVSDLSNAFHAGCLVTLYIDDYVESISHLGDVPTGTVTTSQYGRVYGGYLYGAANSNGYNLGAFKGTREASERNAVFNACAQYGTGAEKQQNSYIYKPIRFKNRVKVTVKGLGPDLDRYQRYTNTTNAIPLATIHTNCILLK